MEERRCFNYRGRETNSFVREKERDPRAAATEEARTSAEGIRKREMMVASFLAKIISSRKESAPGESGAVPWKPGFFERRSLFLSLSSFFFFLFQRGKTSRETPFPFNRVFAQPESFSLSRELEREDPEWNLTHPFPRSFFPGNIIDTSIRNNLDFGSCVPAKFFFHRIHDVARQILSLPLSLFLPLRSKGER